MFFKRLKLSPPECGILGVQGRISGSVKFTRLVEDCGETQASVLLVIVVSVQDSLQLHCRSGSRGFFFKKSEAGAENAI